MADEQKKSGLDSLLYWTPMMAGAGVSMRRAYADLQTTPMNPSSWFNNPSAPAIAANEIAAKGYKLRQQMDYAGAITDMMLKGTYSAGMPDPWARRATAEAMRASLLRGTAMDIGNINYLTQQVLNPQMTGYFDIAAKAAIQSGDPKIFYQTMRGYTGNVFAPGVFWDDAKRSRLFMQASNIGKGSKLLWKQGVKGANINQILSGSELEKLQGWVGQLETAGTGGFTSVTSEMGGVKSAQLWFKPQGFDKEIKFALSLDPGQQFIGGSKYIAPPVLAGLPTSGLTKMSWQDYYVNQMTTNLFPQLQNIPKVQSNRAFRKAIQGFNEQMKRLLLWTPGFRHGSTDLINTINSNMIGVPDLSELGVRKAAVKPNLDLELGLLYQQGYFPASSGRQIMSGHVMTFDPRQLWPYPEMFPVERRPMQFLREFVPTQAALSAMNLGSAFGVLPRSAGLFETSMARDLRAAGITGSQLGAAYAIPGTPAANLLEKMGLAPEQGIMEKGMMNNLFQTERIISKKIGLSESIGQSHRIASWIEAAAQSQDVQPLNLIAGEQIGYVGRTGKTLYASDVPGMTQQLTGIQMLDKDTARLFIKEVHSSDDYIKLFGQVKITTRGRHRSYLQHIKRRAGIQLAENADIFMMSDELRKNRSLLNQQMASGLAVLGQQTAIPEARGLMSLSGEQLTKMYPNEVALIGAAKKWGIDPRLIAGALPGAVKAGIVPQEILTQAMGIMGATKPEELIHPSGWVFGAISPHVGAYRHTVGGGSRMGIRGSMEPRGLSQLLQHRWMAGEANVAPMLAGEILGSMSRGYGRDISESIRIAESLQGKLPEGLDIFAPMEGKLPNVKGPYLLDLGMAGKIYMPGTEKLKRMGRFRTMSGQVLQTDLLSHYSRLAMLSHKASTVADTATVMNEMNASMAELGKATVKEIGASMYGRGGGSGVKGALRGKMLGSLYVPLSSVDPLLGGQVQEGVAEVSERAGRKMYSEMVRAATSQEQRQFLKAQRKAFLRGELVEGMIMRHPMIGPYSIQPTWFRRSMAPRTKTQEFVNLPANLKAKAHVENLGMIEANIAPLTGLAADMDDDRLIVKLIGDQKVAAATRDLLQGGDYAKQYRRFAIESTILGKLAKKKMGAGFTALDDIDKLILGSARLRTTSAETAKISTALSEAKLAMSYYKPEVAGRFNILAEAMEQTIISGKKLGRVGDNLAAETASAIRNIHRPEDLARLQGITEELFGSEITTGLRVTVPGTDDFRFSVNTRQMFKELQSAMVQGTSEGGVVSMYRQLAKGKVFSGENSIKQVLGYISQAREGQADVLAALALEAKPPTTMAASMRETIGGINRGLKEIGSKAASWGRPLLWGLAGTTAALMALGGPKPQPMEQPPGNEGGDMYGLGPQSMRMARMSMDPPQRGPDLRPEALPIPDRQHALPSGHNFASPQAYMTNSKMLKHRIMIEGAADALPESSALSNAIRSVSGSGNVNINYRDNRRKMTSSDVNSILEGM